MTQNIEQLVSETVESYYEYVVKVEGGCATIIKLLKAGDIEGGMQGLMALSEGLIWLLEAEEHLAANSYRIDSPIAQVSPLFDKVNTAIEANDFTTVVQLLEEDVKPTFKTAGDWKFEEVIN